MNWKVILLSGSLVLSIALNIFLFGSVTMWQEAWLEQKMTTGYIEQLFRASGADVSFDAIAEQIEIEFGEFEVIPNSVPNEIYNGAHEYSLLYDGTEFLFNQEEEYAGSLPKIPKNLLSTGIWFDWRNDY